MVAGNDSVYVSPWFVGGTHRSPLATASTELGACMGCSFAHEKQLCTAVLLLTTRLRLSQLIGSTLALEYMRAGMS